VAGLGWYPCSRLKPATRGSGAVRLLRLRVRIPPAACMSVCCKCCVLSSRGLCDGPIPSPKEPYRMWRA